MRTDINIYYICMTKLPQFLVKETLCVIKQNKTLKKLYTKLLLCKRSCTHFVQGDVHILCKVMYIFCILVSIHIMTPDLTALIQSEKV